MQQKVGGEGAGGKGGKKGSADCEVVREQERRDKQRKAPAPQRGMMCGRAAGV